MSSCSIAESVINTVADSVTPGQLKDLMNKKRNVVTHLMIVGTYVCTCALQSTDYEITCVYTCHAE